MTKREATVIASASEARRLGRYVLLGEIAEGGMGRIYLSRVAGAAGFEKMFALKIMHQGLADRSPELAEMFLDEARINSLVRHPNVCAVHDFGDAQGVSFLVMEYMIGQTLLDVLRRVYKTAGTREHPLFWAYAARIVAEACEGLHAAHSAVDEQGRPMHVIHRDISPENVFMTYNGAVKVFDFGIAKATGRRHQTVAGTFKGKFAYASPEAFSSDPLDSRADIWSMGVVLWELLAGRALFHRGTEAEILGAIFQDPIPPVSKVQPACPHPLQTVIDKALARDRSQRYQTAREMARDLNRFAVQTGEHLGTAEIGEWMRELFPGEYQSSVETGQSVQRLDTRQVDAAPQLGDAPPSALISQVVSRGPNAPASLYSEPTVIHAQYPQDEEEETALAGSPMVAEIFTRSDPMDDAPTNIPDFAERDLSSSANLGAPSPFDNQPSQTGSGPAVTGAPSPFVDPPTLEEKKKPLVGKPMKIVLAIVALAGGIYIADMATQGGLVEEAEAEAEAEAETVPAAQGSENEGGEEPEPVGAGEGSAPTASADAAETSPSEPPGETETETETESGTGTGTGTGTESGTGTDSRPSMRRGSMITRSMSMTAQSMSSSMEAAGEPGTVSVFAIGGWADIFEGNRRLGRTPARISLPAGRHTLTLRPEGGRAVRRSVDVPAGGTVRVRVEL